LGKSFTGDPEGYVKEGSGNRSVSLSTGAPLGNLEGSPFTVKFKGKTEGSREIRRLWKRACLSIEALLENLEGSLLPGTLKYSKI
jgi:hypothetical protein